MRLLVTFVGGFGHLAPLLPVALAARDAGHVVAIAGSGGLVPDIEAAGFTAYPTSPQPHHDQSPRPDRERTPLEVMPAGATEAEFAANFADRGARRMASALPEVIRDFRPDIVLRDETDVGSTIAAELMGVPVATHLVLASGLLIRPELVAPPLDAVRAEHGLAPDPALVRLTTGPAFSDAPPSFRSPAAPLPVVPLHYRPAPVPPRPPRDGRPAAYVTLGTIFNAGSGDLFERVVAGLADLDADVVVTTGRAIDPASLGPLPGQVRVERFVPQGEVLPTVDLVVSHGGSGSLVATLAHGVPSLLVPLGADQPHNARRAEELGVARVLDAATLTPDDVADAARTTLKDAAMRARCEVVADEVRSLAGTSAVVATLESLT